MQAKLKKVIPYWPLISVSLLLTVDLLYAQLGTSPVSAPTINYTLISFYQASVFIIPLFALNGIVVFIFHFVSTKSWGGRSRNRANLIAIILFVFVALPCSFLVMSAWRDQLETSAFAHQAQVSFHNESYRLAFIGGVSNSYGAYRLYRCDSLGFSCIRVLEVASPYGSPRTSARIEPDPVYNLLSIWVDGKQIATYSPE